VLSVLVRCSASEWTVDWRSASEMGIWDSRFSHGTYVLMEMDSWTWCGVGIRIYISLFRQHKHRRYSVKK